MAPVTRSPDPPRSPPPLSPWSGWVNAEVYDDYVRERPLYRWLNARLIELADLGSARRVLDLACGTGATARAALAALPADGELVGVDASAEMVGVARARSHDRRARFAVATAARVGTVPATDGRRFDRALCNAGLQLFPDRPAVLAALSPLLSPGAGFAFNLPAARLSGETAPVHPFQVALEREVAARGGAGAADDGVDDGRLGEELAAAGFEVVERRLLAYRGSQGELMELMAIPAMIARAAPDLGVEERAAAVAEAGRHSDRRQPVEVPWVFYLARRR